MDQDNIHWLFEAKLNTYENNRNIITKEDLKQDAMEIYIALRPYPLMHELCDSLLLFPHQTNMSLSRLANIMLDGLIIMHASLN